MTISLGFHHLLYRKFMADVGDFDQPLKLANIFTLAFLPCFCFFTLNGLEVHNLDYRKDQQKTAAHDLRS